MKLSFDKCKVMHYGRLNKCFEYFMYTPEGQVKLKSSECERDLGVMIRSDLKWNTQVRSAAKKANMVLGKLKKTFECRDSDMWTKLYTSLVRPHLEYAVQAWNPHYREDIKILESVQRRATRIPIILRNLSYEK